VETIEEYLGTPAELSDSVPVGGVGDWFEEFWAKLQAGDLGALALVGLVALLAIGFIKR